jgi:lipoprotein-anchoring transpeptidase ErfK/SrfK
MSHGCVNMKIVDAKKLFDWVGEEGLGTKITIYGEAPL